jgi:excisionase family DNA binding protein
MSAIEDMLQRLVTKAMEDVVERRLLPLMSERIASLTAPAEWLKIGEAARHAGVADDTVRDWIQRGDLPEYRAGRHLRVRRDELDRFLSRRSTDAVTDEAIDSAVTSILERRRG